MPHTLRSSKETALQCDFTWKSHERPVVFCVFKTISCASAEHLIQSRLSSSEVAKRLGVVKAIDVTVEVRKSAPHGVSSCAMPNPMQEFLHFSCEISWIKLEVYAW